MFKIVKSKFIAIGLIFSFILFYSPYLLVGKATGSGNLIGFVYSGNGKTPLEGAVVKMRNVSNDSAYESNKSDKRGVFKVEGIDQGLYVVGVSTEEGDFNLENLIGIEANETAKISLVLMSEDSGKASVQQEKKCPLGDWYIPGVEGECEPDYEWNQKEKRCECIKREEAVLLERRGALAFFGSPAGIAVIVAASAAIIYGIVKLTEKEPEASPFKK